MSNIVFISLSTTSQHISTKWDYLNTITQNYNPQSVGIPHLLCLPGWSGRYKENTPEPVFSLIWGHLYFSHPAGVYLINNGSLKSSQVAWNSSGSRAFLVAGRQHRETSMSIHPVRRPNQTVFLLSVALLRKAQITHSLSDLNLSKWDTTQSSASRFGLHSVY